MWRVALLPYMATGSIIERTTAHFPYPWSSNIPMSPQPHPTCAIASPVHGTFVTMVSHGLVRKIVAFRRFPWQQCHFFSHGVSQCPPTHHSTYSSYCPCTAFLTMGNSSYRRSALRLGHVCVPMERLGFRVMFHLYFTVFLVLLDLWKFSLTPSSRLRVNYW